MAENNCKNRIRDEFLPEIRNHSLPGFYLTEIGSLVCASMTGLTAAGYIRAIVDAELYALRSILL